MNRKQLTAAILAVISLLGTAAGVSQAEQVTASLKLNQAAFWAGPAFAEKPKTVTPVCDQPTADCYTYTIRVLEPGWRLRVAFTKAPMSDPGETTMVVFGPDCGPSSPACPRYVAEGRKSREAFIPAYQPQGPVSPGLYTVRLTVSEVSEAPLAYSLRAKLERDQGPSGNATRLPNLRTNPPEGVYQFRCLYQGTADHEAPPENRCLRFSFGWQNVGPGPFMVMRDPLNVEGGQAFQIPHRADGTHLPPRPVGTFEFDPSHGHYHYQDMVSIELFRVLDAERGILSPQPVATAKKLGVCGHDWLIARWDRFDQELNGAHDSSSKELGGDCLAPLPTPGQGGFGVSAGWLDRYSQGQPNNFIDFSGLSDGRYIIRVTVDPMNRILEDDESDNVGYSYIEVSDTHVEVDPAGRRTFKGTIRQLERGHGSDKWAADAQVVGPQT